MSRAILPSPSRIPFATIQGPKGPIEVFVSAEWSRYLDSLNGMANETAYGPGGVAEINADDTWHDDLNAREAMQAVDELRNELATLQSENNALRQAIDVLESRIEEIRPDIHLRARVEQIEDRLQ